MLPVGVLGVVAATFLLHLFSAGTASAQTTSLDLRSQPGDYIGGGVDQTFGPADGIEHSHPEMNAEIAVSRASPYRAA